MHSAIHNCTQQNAVYFEFTVHYTNTHSSFYCTNALINASRFHLHQKSECAFAFLITSVIPWSWLGESVVMVFVSMTVSTLLNESRNSHMITAHCTQTFQSCWLIESLSLHQHLNGGRTHRSACWAFEALVSGQCDMMSWIIMRHCWRFHAM